MVEVIELFKRFTEPQPAHLLICCVAMIAQRCGGLLAALNRCQAHAQPGAEAAEDWMMGAALHNLFLRALGFWPEEKLFVLAKLDSGRDQLLCCEFLAI